MYKNIVIYLDSQLVKTLEKFGSIDNAIANGPRTYNINLKIKLIVTMMYPTKYPNAPTILFTP